MASPKPHAHVMLTLRHVDEHGFGGKNRHWNRTDLLEKWRERWTEHANQRLAKLDIEARIDHRSLEAQGIDLEPQHKIGPAASRKVATGLDLERVHEHREIARSIGAKIIASPDIALDAITYNQATLPRDLAMFAHRYSAGKEQFDRVMAAVRGSYDLVTLGKDGHGDDGFTRRDMIDTEQRLARSTQALTERDGHRVSERAREDALVHAEQRGLVLSAEQRSAFEHVTNAKSLGVIVGMLAPESWVAREAWERAGLVADIQEPDSLKATRRWRLRVLRLKGSCGELVTAGGHAAEVLEAADGVLDEPPAAVTVLIIADGSLAVAPSWNDGTTPAQAGGGAGGPRRSPPAGTVCGQGDGEALGRPSRR